MCTVCSHRFAQVASFAGIFITLFAFSVRFSLWLVRILCAVCFAWRKNPWNILALWLCALLARKLAFRWNIHKTFDWTKRHTAHGAISFAFVHSVEFDNRAVKGHRERERGTNRDTDTILKWPNALLIFIYFLVFCASSPARQHIPFRAEKRSMNFDCKKWLSNWWHGKSWWTCEQQARALANHTGFNPRLRQHFNRTWEHHCRLLKQRWRAHTMPKTTSHDENMIIWIN